MNAPPLGLAPGDFAWIMANSGLDQPEPPRVVPWSAKAGGKFQVEAVLVVPSHYSWRYHPSLAPVSNQGRTATCVAHAACRMLETHFRQQGQTRHLNADCAHQCVYGYPCTMPAAQASNVLDDLRDKGAPQAPGFIAGNACPADADLGLVAVPRFDRANTIAAVKAHLATTGPVLAVMTMDGGFEHLAAPFVYAGPQPGAPTFNHAVMLIGYDDQDHGGMWLCQNSFGTGWGDEGLFRISYAAAGLEQDDLHAAFLLRN